MSEEETPETFKPKRQQRKGRPSKTKPAGSPVVGRQSTTLFGSGHPNAPTPGVSSKRKLLSNRAAELAAQLSVDILEEVHKRVTDLKAHNKSEEAIQVATTNVLALMRDAMDREFGKAGATLDIKSTDGSMSPAAAHTDAVLDALKRKHDPDA